MYPWLVFLHVLAVFGFLMAHGVSASVAFALRREPPKCGGERDLDRIQTLLNLSGSSIGILNGSILLLLLTGIISGFMGRWWGQGWIWLSLGLLIATAVYMSVAASGYYGQVRKAIGLGYMQGFKPHPPTERAGAEELEKLLSQPRPVVLAAIGFGSLAVITWLMKFKPF